MRPNHLDNTTSWRTRSAEGFLLALNLLGIVLMITSALALAVWLTGRLISDRYEWSQWLLWIPTPAALGVALLGLLGAMRPGGRRRRKRLRRIAWLAALTVLAVYFAAIEHRLLSFGDCDAGALRIAHWNASGAAEEDLEAGVETIVDTDADIVVLTNPSRLPWQEPVRQWLGQARPVRQHPFIVLTQLPVLEMRTVASAEHIRMAIVRIDTTEALGRPLTMLLIDLPSDPNRARMETAQRVRQWLDDAQLPAIDMYVGDFNLTRNSASLHTIAPEHEHAFNIAGRGYGATYPRELPVFHIDHMLVSPTASDLVQAYCLRDPGTSRHVMQVVKLRADN